MCWAAGQASRGLYMFLWYVLGKPVQRPGRQHWLHVHHEVLGCWAGASGVVLLMCYVLGKLVQGVQRPWACHQSVIQLQQRVICTRTRDL